MKMKIPQKGPLNLLLDPAWTFEPENTCTWGEHFDIVLTSRQHLLESRKKNTFLVEGISDSANFHSYAFINVPKKSKISLSPGVAT